MNLIRCENGHFYDSERFQTCPHCNQGGVNTIYQDSNGSPMYTVALDTPEANMETIPVASSEDLGMTVPVVPQNQTPPPAPAPMQTPASSVPQQQPVQGSGLADLVSQVSEDGGQATIGYFGDMKNEPVVGWLVAIDGAHYGQDFKLKTGRNFIGRSSHMDVALELDPSISREKHAIILYEPRGNIFLVQPGDAKELFYLNDKVVLSATEINAYDVLSLGDTKLLFIPCCSERFNWDKEKKESKE